MPSLLMCNLTGIIPEEHQALQVVAPSPDVMGNYAGGLINQVCENCYPKTPYGKVKIQSG